MLLRDIASFTRQVFSNFVSFSLQASPGICQVLGAVEALFNDSTRGSRVAELARIIGEKRVCKIELEVVTLPVIVYCIEHELLESALQPLRTMVSRGAPSQFPLNCGATLATISGVP